MSTMDHRRAFSPSTLAERWSCSAQTVRNLIRRGHLAAIPFGRSFRISAAEVDRYEGVAATPADPLKTDGEANAGNALPPRTNGWVGPKRGYWPAAMAGHTAAAYCEITEAAYLCEVAEGRLPAPIILGGEQRWRRAAIDDALARLDGLGSRPA